MEKRYASPVRIGDSFSELKRKMRPFVSSPPRVEQELALSERSSIDERTPNCRIDDGTTNQSGPSDTDTTVSIRTYVNDCMQKAIDGYCLSCPTTKWNNVVLCYVECCMNEAVDHVCATKKRNM